MAALTPEKKVQNEIEKYLDGLAKEGEPVYYERRQATASTKKGLPDLFMIYAGLHIEIEVKKPGGEQSVAQEKYEIKFTKIGVPYLLIDNFKEFKEIIEKLR